MHSQVSIANFKFFLSENLNCSNEIQIFVYACLFKSKRWKACENAYFYFKDSVCLWSEHWKCADENLYI